MVVRPEGQVQLDWVGENKKRHLCPFLHTKGEATWGPLDGLHVPYSPGQYRLGFIGNVLQNIWSVLLLQNIHGKEGVKGSWVALGQKGVSLAYS